MGNQTYVHTKTSSVKAASVCSVSSCEQWIVAGIGQYLLYATSASMLSSSRQLMNLQLRGGLVKTVSQRQSTAPEPAGFVFVKCTPMQLVPKSSGFVTETWCCFPSCHVFNFSLSFQAWPSQLPCEACSFLGETFQMPSNGKNRNPFIQFIQLSLTTFCIFSCWKLKVQTP